MSGKTILKNKDMINIKFRQANTSGGGDGGSGNREGHGGLRHYG